MRTVCGCIIMWLAGANIAMAQTPPGAPTDVPVEKVVLYSSGVGYFEHGGKIKNNASTELRFKTNQINDLLKSLVLEDLDGGRVTTVVYPSQDPLAKTLTSFQVDISGNPSLGDLLGQLRGAEVKVTVGSEELSGTILGVEQRQQSDAEGRVLETSWWLNLLTGGVIRSFNLAEIRRIELQDEQLRDELNKALAAVAQARDQDKKPVEINFMGQGERRVRVGYVVETPIWKTSYRLVLPEDGTSGKLQGWAIVENQTESDWNGVTLSLVSGRPISFVQNLYQPLYVPRPVVQPELYASLSPQAYGGAMDVNEDGFAFGRAAVPESAAAPMMKAARPRRGAAPAPAASDEVSSLASLGYMAGGAGVAGTLLDVTASVSSMATADDIGELFEYTVENVSLPRQRSAMIPIVTDEIEIERLSIYNESVMAKYPLNGARLKNTTGKQLLQGPITVLDAGAYAGDARIEDLPQDQERLLSYAVDLAVHVDATKNSEDTSLLTGKIVQGVLHLSRKRVTMKEYRMQNKGDKDRTMVVEHPVRRDFKLVDTPAPIESTERVHRFKDTVKAGQTSVLTVKEEHVYGEILTILPMDFGPLEFYSRAGEIPPAVREALVKAIEYKRAVVATERQLEERNQRIASITAEQQRIRENMKTVDRNSDYSARLLKKLNDQESQIEALQSEVAGLQEKLNQQRTELEKYLASLTIDQ